MIRKNGLTVSLFVAFCLAVFLFAIIPVTGQVHEYNPWLDTNDDGYVGIDDLFNTAQGFGTQGDPTKTVNIVDIAISTFGYKLQLGLLNISWINNTCKAASFPMQDCAGYDEFYVYAYATKALPGIYNATLGISYVEWTAAGGWAGDRWEYANTDKLEVPVTVNESAVTNGYQFIADGSGFNVKGPYFTPWFVIKSCTASSAWIEIYVEVYYAKR
jgi:hypothetical protein